MACRNPLQERLETVRVEISPADFISARISPNYIGSHLRGAEMVSKKAGIG